MNQQPNDLVIELLRAMRTDVSDIRTDIRDVKARIGSIESYIATLHGDQARAAIKLDDLTELVERLEKRTGLVDA